MFFTTKKTDVQHIEHCSKLLSLLYYFESIRTDFMKIKYKLSDVYITMDGGLFFLATLPAGYNFSHLRSIISLSEPL